jgi:hypothetical protein
MDFAAVPVSGNPSTLRNTQVSSTRYSWINRLYSSSLKATEATSVGGPLSELPLRSDPPM